MQQSIDYSRLADYYDSFVKVTHDLDFFIKEAKKVRGKVLELMSGTGRVSLPLLEAGVSVTCVDKSSEMLAILERKIKNRGISASLYQMDICELALGTPFDLIIIPFNSFAELLSESLQIQALSAIHNHLSPDGCFICTLHNPNIRLSSVNGQQRFCGKYPLETGEGTIHFWILETYDSQEGIVNGIEFFEEYDSEGLLRSKRAVDIRFRLIHKVHFEKLFDSVGFKTQALYGDYDYSDYQEDNSPFMIWILKK